MLELKNVGISFGGLQAVKRVSFQVRPGQVKALIGPNGAGKTTLFNLITGMLKPDHGLILFQNRRIQGLPPFRIAEQGISRTFQIVQLFGHMSVLENVMVGRHVRTRAGLLSAALRLPVGRREEAAIRTRADIGWILSVWPPGPMITPAICPWGINVSWRLPGPWPRNQNCCSWMNLRPDWI